MSGFDDKYIYGLDGKQHYTPDRATEPDEDKEYKKLYSEKYENTLNTLYAEVRECLVTGGDLYTILGNGIVFDIDSCNNGYLDDKDINKTIIEAVLSLQKKETSLKDVAFNAGLALINKGV